MKKVLLLLLITFLITQGQVIAFGPSAGVNEEKRKGITKEKTLEAEKTKEKKKTKGKKEEKHVSVRLTKEVKEAVNKALALKDDKSFTVTLTISDIAFPVLLELEKRNVEPFSSCKLISNPPTLPGVGINYVTDGIIDVIAKEYWTGMAAQDAFLPDEVSNRIKKLALCAINYAEKIGSAVICLKKELKKLKNWVGITDVRKLFRECLKKPEYSGVKQICEQAKKLIGKCRFKGDLNHFLCGGLKVTISDGISVKFGKIFIYADNHFAGMSAEYKVSSAWSLSKAWEKVKEKLKAHEKTKQLVKYVDYLEAKGKVYKAALLKKRVLDQARTGRLDLTLSPNP